MVGQRDSPDDRQLTAETCRTGVFVSIGNLYRLRLREDGGCETWAADTTEGVIGEVAAALRISQDLAANHLWHARAMRERLPKTANVFVAGDIDYLMFQILASRTVLITDDDALAAVDAELSLAIARWPSLSRGQLAGRVDRIVARHDRDAVRRRKKRSDDRAIDIWDSGDGLSEIRGFLRCMDGRALDERLDALAATVCPNDPRAQPQRRADAIGALAAGADRMACECDRADCMAGQRPSASPVVIHVIAEQATIDGASDAPGSTIDPDGLIPPELVQELAKSAKLAPLVHPGDAQPECGYTASRKLADFVRCRDMTCRFLGCDRPAVGCDLDHTIPFGDGGRTHASNLKCLCRIHYPLNAGHRFCVPRGSREPFQRSTGRLRSRHHVDTHGRTVAAVLRFRRRFRGYGSLYNTRPTRGVRVNIKKLAGAVAATAITFSVGAATVAPAWAVDNVKPFGNQERLNDRATGAPMIGYTVRDLSPSSDPVPHNGQLYEATVTVDAFGSWATPMIPMFNARAESSAIYRVLADAGVGGAVPPGGSTTGKLYFDVVGDVPNSVVYNDGVRDLLAWVPGPPEGGTRP